MAVCLVSGFAFDDDQYDDFFLFCHLASKINKSKKVRKGEKLFTFSLITAACYADRDVEAAVKGCYDADISPL